MPCMAAGYGTESESLGSANARTMLNMNRDVRAKCTSRMVSGANVSSCRFSLGDKIHSDKRAS
jgi:hypothetical protein